MWGSEGSAWRVRNRVFDEESNSSTRTRLRSITPEEGVTRERYLGVRDVLREESFCKQITSGLSVATCMERSVRLERRPRIFEFHTVHEEGGEGLWVQGRGV